MITCLFWEMSGDSLFISLATNVTALSCVNSVHLFHEVAVL